MATETPPGHESLENLDEPPARQVSAPSGGHRADRARQAAGRRRRLMAVAAGAAAIVVAVIVGWVAAGIFLGRHPSGPAPPATVEVSRRNLAETRVVGGILGYGDERKVPNWVQGVVTWLPGIGSTVSRGKILYRVDELPVVLLYGQVPMYRALQAGTVGGSDVRELEENLAALGYGGFTVDGDYTAQTASAVQRWQADVGLPQTGIVDFGRVVMEPDAVRISATQVPLGGRATPGQPVLTCTGTARIVSVDLPVTDQNLAAPGKKTAIELPDRTVVSGTVAHVGTVARPAPKPGSQTPGSPGVGTPTIRVTITVDDPARVGALDQAPVDVRFVSEEHTGVLTVPVPALLALRGGGYGVRVVHGDTSYVVPVEVGIFANGFVEVSGRGITAGTVVEVPPAS